MLSRLKAAIADTLDFQSRLWVVNVFTGDNKGESFVVNEDSFKEPLQWMKRKGYSGWMLNKVDGMRRSQIIEFELDSVKHRLMRVK